MVEREWREASDLRTSRIALAAVLLSAAVLRLWGVSRGIPYAVQIDEPEIVERAFNMMRSGSLHPHFFDYPGLSLYIQLAVSIARFIAGAIGGEWYSLGQATGGSFYLWGRVVTALDGTATVLVVYQIGMRWGARHALLAAGLMAVLPLHVRYSHFVLTDTPLTFFVALTFLLSLVAHERGTLASFATAGAASGLAAATKYNGGIALMMPVIACWMTYPAAPGRVKTISPPSPRARLAFLLLAPYTILDLPDFSIASPVWRISTAPPRRRVAMDPLFQVSRPSRVRLAGHAACVRRHGPRVRSHRPWSRPRPMDARDRFSGRVLHDADDAEHRVRTILAADDAVRCACWRRSASSRASACCGDTRSPARRAPRSSRDSPSRRCCRRL